MMKSICLNGMIKKAGLAVPPLRGCDHVLISLL